MSRCLFPYFNSSVAEIIAFESLNYIKHYKINPYLNLYHKPQFLLIYLSFNYKGDVYKKLG